MFAEQILTVNDNTGEIIVPEKIFGHDLCDMNFSLNRYTKTLEMKGICVREFWNKEKLTAGIRFKDMNQEHKEMIRNYISKAIQPQSLGFELPMNN